MVSTILGFDFGSKKIGVAVGQSLTQTASGLETIQFVNKKPDWTRIEKLIKEWQPDTLLVGIPYNMDGTEQPISKKARAFAQQLQERFSLDVQGVDERLSTRASWQLLSEHSTNSYQTKRKHIDQVCATLIIETWFSSY